jgi:hypothetical protein
MRKIIWLLVILLVGIFANSCATTQSRYSMLGQSYPSRSEDCKIDVFKTGSPDKKFIKISRLDVHLEKTHFIGSNFEDALPELKKQACKSGADAIIDVQERSSMVGETKIYHVTATGIKYTEPFSYEDKVDR